MELKRIEYTNVYGFVSGDISFTNGVNLLVGINGCGKTTVLNLIRWVLEPSLPDLCTIEHDLIRVELNHNGREYSIESLISEDKHQLKISTQNNNQQFEPICTPLKISPKLLRTKIPVAAIRTSYEGLRPERHEVTTWDFLINELPSPIFVGLERKVQKKLIYQRQIANRMRARQSNESVTATSNAINLIRDASNTAKRTLVEINEELNQEVLKLSFSGIILPNSKFKDISYEKTKKKIAILKNRFEKSLDESEYSKVFSNKGVKDAILKYLQNLEGLLVDPKKYKDDIKNDKDNIWLALNNHNFERASNMFDLFENHEKTTKKAQKEINNFQCAINKFINDSGKSIHFDKDTGNPFFKSNIFPDNILGLTELSSGEAQIVILFSYFAFLAKTGIPIIIDEPELSIHVEWQQFFIEAVKQLMPPDCQTIMATHSPEICGADNVNVQHIPIGKRHDS